MKRLTRRVVSTEQLINLGGEQVTFLAFGSGRIRMKAVDGAAEVMTPRVVEILLKMHDRFKGDVNELRSQRHDLWNAIHTEVANKGIKVIGDVVHSFFKRRVVPADWKMDLPPRLVVPGVDICNGVGSAGMALNAVNPMPAVPDWALDLLELAPYRSALMKPQRAARYLDCNEDANGYTIEATINAIRNRKAIADRTLHAKGGGILPEDEHGELPVRMHRPPGLLLDELQVEIDGKPVSATLFDMVLTLTHVGPIEARREGLIAFYYPKSEGPNEMEFVRRFLDAMKEEISELKNTKIRVVPLVESVPTMFTMEDCLYELGEYAGGLNYARWDLMRSIFYAIMTDPKAIYPDRFGVTPWNTDFLTNLGRVMVAICRAHGGMAFGGMDVALVDRRHVGITTKAIQAIVAAKWREASEGFPGSWAAHPDLALIIQVIHQMTAYGEKPGLAQLSPLAIEVPTAGKTTFAGGALRDLITGLEFLAGPRAWFAGWSAVGIDSDPYNPDPHPPLMDDKATWECAIFELAYRMRHRVTGADGFVHTMEAYRQALARESNAALNRWLAKMGSDLTSEERDVMRVRFMDIAPKVIPAWVERYAALDYTEIAQFTRGGLLQSIS